METEKEYEQRIASAERAHDWARKAAEQHNHQVEAFSLLGMKTPALVAAGGVAAALGFYSANYTRLKVDPANLTDFNSVLSWLFIALVLTSAAPGMAYFSQIAYVSSLWKKEHEWEHPFVRETASSKRWEIVGDICRWAAVALTAGSIILIVMAGYQFLSLVNRI